MESIYNLIGKVNTDPRRENVGKELNKLVFYKMCQRLIEDPEVKHEDKLAIEKTANIVDQKY